LHALLSASLVPHRASERTTRSARTRSDVLDRAPARSFATFRDRRPPKPEAGGAPRPARAPISLHGPGARRASCRSAGAQERRGGDELAPRALTQERRESMIQRRCMVIIGSSAAIVGVVALMWLGQQSASPVEAAPPDRVPVRGKSSYTPVIEPPLPALRA